MDFSPGWDCFLPLCPGIMDVATLGILVDDSPCRCINLIAGGFMLLQHLFVPWPIVMSMLVSGGTPSMC